MSIVIPNSAKNWHLPTSVQTTDLSPECTDCNDLDSDCDLH